MGIQSLAGMLTGAGDVSRPNAQLAGQDFATLLQNYLNMQPSVYANAAQLSPQYGSLFSNIWNTGFQPTLTSTAPAAFSAMMTANPGGAGLLNNLTRSANAGLDAGANLPPALAQLLTQNVRGAQAARGLGRGPSDAIGESAALTSLGNQWQQQRQQFAQGVGALQQGYTLPTLGTATTAASGAGGAGVSGGQSGLTSQSLMASILGLPMQLQLQAALGQAQNNTGLYESMDRNFTSFVSSGGSGGGA